MVLSTCILCCSNRLRQTPKTIKRKFIDSLRIHIKAGPGGMGFPKFGGIGGTGGNVYAEGREDLQMKNVLRKFPSKRVRATSGENSHSKCIVGSPGEDITIETPLGVTIFSESGKKLGEIDKDGDKVLVAKGGAGGCKDTGFSGLKGESGVFIFDLKLIADVGLVGFPNAGKSTLLSAISNAKPKIASYPFTTLNPELGVISYPDLRKVSVADLPGLIEGAHENIGLGHRFLKHIERTKLLALVVDVGGFQLGPRYKPRNCLETIILLNKELEMYREDLVNTPALLIINKMDKPGAENIFEEVRNIANHLEDVFQEVPENIRPLQPLRFEEIIGISAKEKHREEIEKIKCLLRDIMDQDVESETKINEKALLSHIESRYKEFGPKML